jgi:hypothetical protein
MNYQIKIFNSGVNNLIDKEDIPKDSAKDSLNWITRDGQIELARGKALIGSEGLTGRTQSSWFGYKTNGDTVFYRKIDTKIQYFDGSAWQDIITGLDASHEYTFQNYSSLAGSFTFATGLGGLFKIHNANPASYTNMYNASINFKGKCVIDKGRMLLYDVENDPTGLYGSHIDPQDSSVYTSVSGEATTSLTGTLAFKGSNPTANCFGVQITLTGSGEVYTDDYLGNLTGSLGGTGTINYITGAYTLSNSGVGTANYQWEDSNSGGITDFTYSTPRVAGEGFVLPQDEGGDPIKVVLVGLDGSYTSLKENSAYRYIPDATDTNPINEIFRKNIGVQYWQSAVSTGVGIIFIDTSNPEKPKLTLIEKNPIGDNLLVKTLCDQFKFENYLYDEAVLDTWGQYIILSCKTPQSNVNDRLLLINLNEKSQPVDITYYGAKSVAKDDGILYIGGVFTQSTYKVFNGFDDDSDLIDNYWEGKDEDFGVDRLKKIRRLRIGGQISKNQSCEVYLSFDDNSYQLVGTILGDGTYVDASNTFSIGSTMIGDGSIGGETTESIYNYYLQLKIKCPKFRSRSIKFVAKGFGFMSINKTTDFDVLSFEDRMPKKYRLKQNVSLDGAQIDLDNPQF